VAPIRVARFALSDHYPCRDLYLSPQHSLFIDGFLIPVEWLVNGKSIALATRDDRDVIDYFHIELETHEVVFAEGAAAETVLIKDDREDFANFVEYERLYGIDRRPAMKPFAPVLKYEGGRGELERLLRLAMSRVVDVRDPIQRARDRIAARAERIPA
jgi:hypothetical protein